MSVLHSCVTRSFFLYPRLVIFLGIKIYFFGTKIYFFGMKKIIGGIQPE